MKKISLILAFALILGLSASPAAAKESSGDKSFDKALTLLEDIGAAGGESLEADSEISRIEFIKLLISSLGTEYSVSYTTGAFGDVSAKDSGYDELHFAANMGLVAPADNFFPQRTVTLAEAAKITAVLLGYDVKAGYMGGYPSGYLAVAGELGILKGIAAQKEELTQRQAYKLIYNTLNAKLVRTSFGSGNYSRIADSNETIMSFFHKARLVKGRIDGNEFYSEGMSGGLGKNRISVDGEVFESGKFSLNGCIGMKAEAYVRDSGNKYETLLSVYTDSEGAVTVDAEKAVSFSSGIFTYSDADGEKKVRLPLDATILLNGKEFSFAKDKFIPDSGSITLIGEGGRYDTVIIKSYVDYVVNGKIADKYTVTDKYDSSKRLVIDPDDDSTTLINQNRRTIEFGDIKTGSVLSVAASGDGKVKEVILVEDSIYGSLTGTGKNSILVDDREYRLTPAMKNEYEKIIGLGGEGIFHFNINGQIASIEAMPVSNSRIGYVARGGLKGKGIKKTLAAVILSQDGSLDEHEFAPVFTVNKIVFTDHEKAFSALKTGGAGGIKCDVVLYELNSKKQIAGIEYADTGITGEMSEKTSLYVTDKIAETDRYTYYQSSWRCIRKNFFVNPAAPIFKVLNPASTEPLTAANYKIIKPINLENAVYGYKLVGYTTAENSGIAEYILMQRNSAETASENVSEDAWVVMVDKIKTVMSSDGEVMEAADIFSRNEIVFNGAKLRTVTAEKGFFGKLNIKPGDLIKIDFTDDNKATAAEVVYRQGSDTLEYTNSAGEKVVTYGAGDFPQCYIGLRKVYKRRGSVIDTIAYNADPESASPSLYSVYPDVWTVIRYNKDKNCVETANIESFYDYYRYGAECTKMIINARSGDPRTLYIVD